MILTNSLHPLLTIVFSLCLALALSAQPIVEVRVENQTVVGTDFFFDIYLNTAAGSPDLYLGPTDIVLDFNRSNFTNPSLSKVGTGGTPEVGHSKLTSTNYGDPTDFNTQIYVQFPVYQATVPVAAIADDRMIINLNTPGPSSTADLNDKIARIDGTPQTHRLGRFKVSGITNPAGSMGLVWICSGLQRTRILSYKPSTLLTEEATVVCRMEDDALLPLELLDFRLEEKETGFLLTWHTEEEANLRHYVLQRATDAVHFKEVKLVEGLGRDASGSRYQVLDETVMLGQDYYYRLEMVYEDGETDYSEIVKGRLSLNGLSLHPNPATEQTELSFEAEQSGLVHLSVFNSLGVRLKYSSLQADLGTNTVRLDLNELESGIYLVELSQSSQAQTLKLLKVN